MSPHRAADPDVFVVVIAALASPITWGLGLVAKGRVAGGLLAKEVAAQLRAKAVKLRFPSSWRPGTRAL